MQGISNGHDFHSMLQRFEKISLLLIAKTLIIFIMLDNKILDVISWNSIAFVTRQPETGVQAPIAILVVLALHFLS